MDIDDFRTLLLNRSEIEKALGLNLTNVLTADEQYLSDYAMFPVIPLESVIAIFLGLNPDDQNRNRKHPRYWTIYKAIENAVRRGEISAEVDQEFDINGNEYQYDISLSHDVAKAWAKVHGLKWNVPPYRPIKNFNDSEPTQESDTKKDEIIESQRIENETLRARIAELENQLKEQSAVNSEQVLEYDGDLPAGTNEDKLAYFFELIIDPALLNDDGEMPTYSQLHTRLNHKHNKKTIPSKNTIKKYLNQ